MTFLLLVPSSPALILLAGSCLRQGCGCWCGVQCNSCSPHASAVRRRAAGAAGVCLPIVLGVSEDGAHLWASAARGSSHVLQAQGILVTGDILASLLGAKTVADLDPSMSSPFTSWYHAVLATVLYAQVRSASALASLSCTCPSSRPSFPLAARFPLSTGCDGPTCAGCHAGVRCPHC
jgi:hypothetical protein